MNKALLANAMAARNLADVLQIQLPTPVPAPCLSLLSGFPSYLMPGLDPTTQTPKPNDESLKGFAALGYVSNIISPELKRLNALPEEERKSLQPEGWPLEWHALRNSLSGKTIITPTSGNFGLAFLRIIHQVESLGIIKPHSCRIRPWLPNPENKTAAPNPDKVYKVMLEFKGEGLKDEDFGFWDNRADRDAEALAAALKEGALYCHTNPLSRNEMARLLEKARDTYGADLNSETAKHTMQYLGASVHDEQVYVKKDLLGGAEGLVLPWLISQEFLASTGKYRHEVTVIQPSAGGTLAAAIAGASALKEANPADLEKYFPNLARNGRVQGRIFAARTTGNENLVTGLGHRGYDELPGAAWHGKEISGLGTRAPHEWPTDIIHSSLAATGELRNKGDILAGPTVMTKLAQAIIFADRYRVNPVQARIPEEAGAVGVSALLELGRVRNILKPEDVAFVLIQSGMNAKIFGQIMGDGFPYPQYDAPEHRAFGAAVKGIMDRVQEVEDFGQVISDLQPHVSVNVANHIKDLNAFTASQPDSINKLCDLGHRTLMVYMTGNTGTANLTKQVSRGVGDNQRAR